MAIASSLRAARLRAGLSQAELAARARTSQPAVARYESGRAVPSVATLERLLAVTGSSIVLGAARTNRRSGRRARVLSLVRRARARLLKTAERHGVHRVRVFGSVARGTARTTSDVDLLVDLDPERTLLDLIAFQQEAEEILGLPVDVVSPRFMKGRVRQRALRDARPL
jgi:predicted nucleotidyltransferase/DNA-binding XRE family transcriptional regulator